MNYLRGAVSATYQYYKDINPSTLTGAIDVIVVRRRADDGDIYLACSPFHVRFGKLQVLRPADKKVNVFINGNPIPFGMKIGDAGEAFFVVETEEDIPEDLVTSPLLTATSTTPQKDIPSVASKADSSQAEIPQIEADSDIPEPEFLDLDATSSEQAMSRRPRARSVAQSDDVAPVLAEDEGVAPDVQYKDDVALDMAGYHSVPSQSKRHHGDHSNQRIPHHPRESKETVPHNRIPFPLPEPSRDHLTPDGNSTPPRLRERSWEGGAFHQPSPVQTHFTPSFIKGKSKAIDDIEDDSEDNGRGLTRSRSVPPELEGSPHSVHVSLPPPGPNVDPNAPLHERSFSLNTEPDELGASGRLAASRSDPTKFRVSIDGKTAAFKLSLVERREVFHEHDEHEAAHTFEAGVIDYHRFVGDDELVSDERLVMKWNDGQYITREDQSPLMNALNTWRASSSQEGLIDDLPSPSSPQDPSPSSSDEGELRHSEFEPTSPFPRKPSPSSSWVRWWSRGKDIPETERPVLRESTTIPLHAKFPRVAPASIGKPASAPPGTPILTQSPVPKPVDQPIPTKPETQKRYAKTLRLTSDQLKVLDLKLGANTITFSLTTGGAPACTARIFVWESTDRIVVSDIDGTITKSDGLGHIFTMIGRDWTHSGVAKLYSDIVRNGYRIMYLTSRAIGQADSTRDYLKGIKQDDLQLPEGPVILSPDRVIASLHREVIMRKPEVFKMACLRDIQRLFGDMSHTPFYAGFGNRITDALSYRSVSIPSSRIFTIDSSSTVKMELLELAGYKSSYIHMADLVDQIFPPIHRSWEIEFTCFNFWKIPVQEFPLPDLTPPSPALSARSDTSTRNAFARLRNFSIGGKQSVSLSTPSLIGRGTETGTGTPAEAGTVTVGGSGVLGERNTHLRQMSSFEKLSSRLAALALSSSPSTLVESGEESPRSRSSVSSTMLDSDEEAEGGVDGGTLKRERRPRSTSVTSMPGSIDNGMHFAMDEDDEETHEYDEEENGDEYVEEAVEEAAEEEFDRDFLATTEMRNVPFL